MIGLPSLRVRWVLAVSVPLLGVLWLSGCENTFEYARYPKDLNYPLRTDPIVVSKPKGEVFAAPGPGRLEEEIAQVPKLGGETKDPNSVAGPQRSLLQAALVKTFGTPRLPRVGAPKGEDDDVVKQLTTLKVREEGGDDPFHVLAHGSKVYRFHCVHCHGLVGDGRGPTGPWVVPHPRDYRLGEFKFTSTDPDVNSKKPRRDDLLRTLRNGIENTSMPSFALYDIRTPDDKEKDTDLEAVVSYVIHLSIRGLVEKRILSEIIDGAEYNAQEMDTAVHDAMKEVVGQWAASDAKPIAPPKDSYQENGSRDAREASIRHGYQLFSDPSGAASCIGCHADYGRQVNFRYDDWGTVVRPMNLTTGVYRGGRRPIDLYWRVKGGIDPSGMPKTGLQNDKDIWDVVNFVQAMPYPQMLPEDVRYKVYDRPPEEHKGERAER